MLLFMSKGFSALEHQDLQLDFATTAVKQMLLRQVKAASPFAYGWACIKHILKYLKQLDS